MEDISLVNIRHKIGTVTPICFVDDIHLYRTYDNEDSSFRAKVISLAKENYKLHKEGKSTTGIKGTPMSLFLTDPMNHVRKGTIRESII